MGLQPESCSLDNDNNRGVVLTCRRTNNGWLMDIAYDIETYPNCFTCAFQHVDSGIKYAYEISDRVDQSQLLLHYLNLCIRYKVRLVGFNNLGFDYPVIHMLIKMNGRVTARQLYDKAMAIIGSQDRDRFQHTVWPKDRYIEQLDLFKIHHFDNKARATSLKMLEFNMRMDNIQDLPFPVGTELNSAQIDVLKEYNQHDVSATVEFYKSSLDMIKFREQLNQKYQKDFMNHNDVKIGTDYFQMKLEQAGVVLYEYGSHGRKPKQTKRSLIDLGQCILPWIKFEQPEFQRVLGWMRQQKITETKGVFKDLIARVDGFEFVFGLGGIHGSVESQVVEADGDYAIIDLDVASYYPNIAISQEFYPQHLGKEFCTIYKHLYEQRNQYPKGTAENAMLKLALNGAYGQSNSAFSVFYDPHFTMSVTLNGQLLLSLLAQSLMKIPDLTLIQVNTDGLTVKVNRNYIDHVKSSKTEWEAMTGLELESAYYSRMFIRDVNNYIAEYEGGKLKRKGVYEYQLEWHQNQSALVIPKVAEQVLVHGEHIRKSVIGHRDIKDFMLRTKVPRSSKLVGFDGEQDHQLQNITRYIVTKEGVRLFKLMPPTPKMLKEGKNEWRRIGVQSGKKVTPLNTLPNEFNQCDIDYEYYIREVEKLVLGLC